MKAIKYLFLFIVLGHSATILFAADVLALKENFFPWGSSGRQGHRPSMEDATIAVELPGEGSFFAVFDGHGGQLASQILAHGSSEHYPLHEVFHNALGDSIIDKLKKSFEDMDKNLLDIENGSGSTAAVAFIQQGTDLIKLTLAWTGDSRVVVILGDSLFQTKDHKPGHAESKEYQRIEKAGGKISQMRVGGQLAVSRAFGNGPLRRLPEAQGLTALPEIVADIEISPNENCFIIIACDGIWDVLSSADAASIVATSLNQSYDCPPNSKLVRKNGVNEKWGEQREEGGNQDSLVLAARRLVAAAYKAESKDNLSVVVVQVNKTSELFATNFKTIDFPIIDTYLNQ